MLDEIVDAAVTGSVRVDGIEVDAEIERIPQVGIVQFCCRRPRWAYSSQISISGRFSAVD